MIICALLIKMTSNGPAVYTQLRYGLNGTKFYIFKFRTMYQCDTTDEFKQASMNDIRVTKVGAFLRRTSLDELPQLFNILKGNMSLVGSRPHPVLLDENYRSLIKNYMNRYNKKPGVTGLAQINDCRGETDTLEKMQHRIAYDLKYVKNYSLILYFKILLLTPIKIIFHRNAF